LWYHEPSRNWGNLTECPIIERYSMATATSSLPAVFDEWLPSAEGVRREWVEGNWLERPSMGLEAALISTRLMYFLFGHVMSIKAGYCMSHECGYKIFPHEPGRVRFPDGSFIRSERLEAGKIPRGHTQIVPDLIFEVVSPNDHAEDVEERLSDFIKAGVPVAWIIYPLTKQVYVFHQGPASLRLGEGDTLDGEDVLPGFSLPLKDLFAVI
jgi:Uma2 family endonuclease